MNKKISFKELDFSFFCLFFLTVPFSVTLSQAFAVLSILSYLVFRYPKFKDFPLIFWILSSLYLSIFLSRIWMNVSLGKPYLSEIMRTESTDFWMCFLLLPASRFTRKEKAKCQSLLKYIGILFLITGFVSFLFPYRLSSYVMDGFAYVEGRRLPHQIGYLNWLHLPLFLPIGFQNTHLTNGALLGLFFPPIFRHAYRLLKIRKRKQNHFPSLAILYLLFSFGSILLILLNQSRSIWFGLLLSSVFLIDSKAFRSLTKQKLKQIFSVTFFLILLAFLLYEQNWLFRRSIEQLFTKQTLENQRVWIHKANFDMIKHHPLLGIGAGNYTEFFEKSYAPVIEKKSYLFYEISITPKSHAHHDFLHFLILGGIISGICFLFLWIQIAKNVYAQGKRKANFLGIYAIFIGSMFQCFVLDDETFLPLLAIYSLMHQKKSMKQMMPILFVILPLFLSILSLYHLSLTNEDQLFIHRTRDETNRISPIVQKTVNGNYATLSESDSDSFYFKLEGCLDQEKNFNTVGKIRKEPIYLNIEFPPDKNQTNVEFPYRYEIELRKRDAFDQDKLYRVHSESILNVIRGEFTAGNNPIQIPLPEIDSSEEIKFFDLGIRYYFRDSSESHSLPILHIRENCD